MVGDEQLLITAVDNRSGSLKTSRGIEDFNELIPGRASHLRVRRLERSGDALRP